MEFHEDNDHISSHSTSSSEYQDWDSELYWGSLLKVPYQLRNVEPNAYTPTMVSIGPYHRHLPHLMEMEFYKQQFLDATIDKTGKQIFDICLQNWKTKQVRRCYSPSLVMDESEFEKMLLLDGCFLLALFSGWLEDFDPIFKLSWVFNAILHDILLLENQLPFFVLVDLYDMIVVKGPTSGELCFASYIFSIISTTLPGPRNRFDTISNNNIKHLLHLLHDNWSPSSQGIQRHQRYCNGKKDNETRLTLSKGTDIIHEPHNNIFKRRFICCSAVIGKKKKNNKLQKVRKLGQSVNSKTIHCATELHEAGIRFVNNTEESNVKSLFDADFTDSTLKIPHLEIYDDTERLLRNLIAYEQYAEGSTYLTDYIRFMDDLIDSAKDAQLLRLSGVLHNRIGDDEAIARMFNKLCTHVMLDSDSFYYQEIYVEINKHCARRWNIWKAKLRHDYFNSPWALVSFLAALLVILLTIAQVVFGAFSL